jgi:hypothetical protein
MFKRATLALGLLGAALVWGSPANAYSVTWNIPVTDGYAVGDSVFHSAGGFSDNISVNLTGPGNVMSPGGGGVVALNISFGSTVLSHISGFTYRWYSDNLLTDTGVIALSNVLQNPIPLPFTATPTPGDPYSSYHLLLSGLADGASGGGYVYTIGATPCPTCGSTVVPVPPAAVLFVSALAGLGLLGRKRRKNALTN